MDFFISKISGKSFPVGEQVSCHSLSPAVFGLMRADSPALSREDIISLTELAHYKQKHIENFVLKEIGEISELESEVIDTLDTRKIYNKQGEEGEVVLTFGQRVADKIADFGGSWSFILSFLSFIVVWMIINIVWLRNAGYDPYPFILLNLILSCVAALQAPVIMMSQNRQEEKDRLRAKKDYLVNLKTELEIRILHEKLDYLMDIQHEQTALLKELQENKS